MKIDAILNRIVFQLRYIKYHKISLFFSFFLFLLFLSLSVGINSVKAATLFSDNFSQDSVGNVPTGWSVAGGSWKVQQDGTHVVSQTATQSNYIELVTGSKNWTNYTVQADVKLTASSGSVGIVGRGKDSLNSYMLYLSEFKYWKIYKVVNNGWTLLATGPYAYSANKWYTLGLTFNGSTMTASINGNTVGSAHDTTF